MWTSDEAREPTGPGAKAVALRLLSIDATRDVFATGRLAFWHVLAPVLALPIVLLASEPWTRPALLTVLVLAAVVGAFALVILRRRPDEQQLAVLDTAMFWVDIGLLFTATAVAARSPLALLLIPTLATLRMGRRGAIVGFSVAVLAEVARQLVLVGLRGEPATPIRSVELVAFAGLIAATISQLITQLDRRRSEAEADALVARRSQQQIDSIHRIIMAGIGGGAASVVERVVHEVHVEYGYAGVSVALIEDDDLRFVRMAGGSHPDELVPVDRDGPAARVLAGEDVVIAQDTDLLGLVTAIPGISALIVAAVRGRTGLLGLLMLECDRTGPRPPGELETVRRLGAQLGVLIEAARAFDREAALVADYRRLDEMRRDFVSLTSHELATPATAISGFVETLLTRDIDGEPMRRSLLQATARQAGHLVRLVDDLRTLSVLDSGGMRVDLRHADLDDVLGAVRESVQEHAGDISFLGPPRLSLVTDPTRLVQVLTNLVENALRHGSAPVTVSWMVEGDDLVVTVQDEGPGVPEDRRALIFERFETTADLLAHHRGTGLGLPISRELAERMGGSVELLPSDRGAAFQVRLPFDPIEVELQPSS